MKQLVEIPVFTRLPIENVLRFANETIYPLSLTQLAEEYIFGAIPLPKNHNDVRTDVNKIHPAVRNLEPAKLRQKVGPAKQTGPIFRKKLPAFDVFPLSQQETGNQCPKPQIDVLDP